MVEGIGQPTCCEDDVRKTGRFLIIVSLAALASSCATPETRLRTGLIDAGVSPPLAACMAERMVDRLSLMQLRRLADLPDAREAQSIDQFLRRVRALRDPEILTVTTAAAARCAVGL
jgi:hypothetical protein